MKEWVCRECGLYKKIEPNIIQIGQKVLIKKKMFYKREIFYKILIGVVLKNESDIFSILHEGRIFKLEKNEENYHDATEYFIYNIFSDCECGFK